MNSRTLWIIAGTATVFTAVAVLDPPNPIGKGRDASSRHGLALVRSNIPQTAPPAARASFQGPKLSATDRLREVSRLAGKSVQHLRQLLESGAGVEERTRIVDALAMIGTEPAIRTLLDHLGKERDLETRRRLAEAFKNLTHPEALHPFFREEALLADPAVLRQLITTAERLATPQSVEFLVSLYRAEARFPGQMKTVSKALSQIKNPAAARMLASVAASATEPGLIEAAAHGLAKIGNPAAVEGLIEALNHVGERDFALRRSLVSLLGRITNLQSQAYRQALLSEPLPTDILHALGNPASNRPN